MDEGTPLVSPVAGRKYHKDNGEESGAEGSLKTGPSDQPIPRRQKRTRMEEVIIEDYHELPLGTPPAREPLSVTQSLPVNTNYGSLMGTGSPNSPTKEDLEHVGPIFPLPELTAISEDAGEVDATPSLDNLKRPSVWEFRETVEERYRLDDFSKANQGLAILVDLQSKQQGRVNVDQLRTFARKVARKKPSAAANPAPANVLRRSGSSISIRRGEPTPEHGEDPLEEAIYWADIFKPTADDMEILENAFGIHPLTTEDILTPGTREKYEEYPNYLYVVVNERQVVPGSNRFVQVNVNILVFPGIVFSIHNSPVSSFTQVMYQVEYGPEILAVDWIMYKFLDLIVDEHILMVEAVYREVDHLDAFVLTIGEASKEELLRRMGVARQRLTQLRGTLLTKKELVTSLTSELRISFVRAATKLYLRDVMDHIMLMVQRLDMASEMLNNTNSTHLALISIDIAETDHRMNEAMKCFGAVATIMLPLTVLTGLWGMNVQVPGQTGLHTGLGWFTLIISGFVFWILMASIIFKYKRWL